MTTVYHELLPESYLLLLTPGSPQDPELALDFSLKCAYSSGKSAVWVDCELVNALSATSAQALWAYHNKLHEEHKQLLVVHASDEVKQDLLNFRQGPGTSTSICFTPTLIDAAWQSGLRLEA